MKHNLPPAKTETPPGALILIGLALFVSGCATATRMPHPTALNQVGLNNPANRQLININTAPAAELEKLPGIGKSIAERIVAHRQQYGWFRRAEHLLMVRGVSDRKLRAIRSKITAD